MGGTKLVASKGGATSSVVPPLEHVPYDVLVLVAERFRLGAEKHGTDNWRGGLGDVSYAINRAVHVANHAHRLIAKLQGRLPFDQDDDVAAILWGGAFLSKALAELDHTEPSGIDGHTNDS